MSYAGLYSNTAQSKPLDDSQVENNAGGYVYNLDKWDRLERFLVLGSDAPTYYQNAADLTRENGNAVIDCLNDDAVRTMQIVVDVSFGGRAPKNDPAIFALALGAAHSDVKVRQVALSALPKVCRTSTHLFQFIGNTMALGKGWGRALKRAVGNWYSDKSVDDVAYQAIKYRNREGFTHERALDLCHPPCSDDDPSRIALYRWMLGRSHEDSDLPSLIKAHMSAMSPATTGHQIKRLIRENRLPWEAIPTACLTDPEMWKAMASHLGLTAVIRNLGRMTQNEAIQPLGDLTGRLCERLTSKDEIRKSRVHPYQILQALAVYRSGRGVRGAASWQPVTSIIDALDEAFYLAFENVEPTGKRIMLALDVSGSMGWSHMGSVLTAAEGAAAMAMVTVSAEQNVMVTAFSRNLTPVDLSARQRLDGVIQTLGKIPMGGTDCSQPMLYAQAKKLDVDAFVIYTDNETWAGRVHPIQALRDYRMKSGIDAKLIVVGMTSTGFTIADPKDAGNLDVVGFDAACPALISNFIAG